MKLDRLSSSALVSGTAHRLILIAETGDSFIVDATVYDDAAPADEISSRGVACLCGFDIDARAARMAEHVTQMIWSR
jgi:hypothetical protein